MNMIFREATSEDISQIQIVRNAVKENVLSIPGSISDQDCEEFINVRGKGWVCQLGSEIVGFAIADLKQDNIWALFVRPEYEGKGIGTKLHKIMIDWYFSTGKDKVWLGTSPNTKAEKFYRKHGWKQNGFHGDHELKFELSRDQWKKLHSS